MDEEPAEGSETLFNWGQHDDAEACQPTFDEGEPSSSECSSDTASSEDAQVLEALQPSLDASFEVANYMRRAGLPRSMVQELLDLLHNQSFVPAEVRFHTPH